MKQRLKQLAAVVQSLRQNISDMGKKDQLDEIRKELEDINAGATSVTVCGEFKRGKSTFINALIGRDICATDIDICTSVVSIIRYGETEKAVRAFGDIKNPQTEEISLDDLEKYTVGSREQVCDTIFVEIYLPAETLRRGLIVIDTPGVGGLDPRHAALTNLFLKNTNLAVFITDVNEPLTSTELQFFKDSVMPGAQEHLIVVNKTDLKETCEVEEIAADTREKFITHCALEPEALDIVCVSSAAEAYPDYDLGESHFDLIRQKIEELSDRNLARRLDDAADKLKLLISECIASINTQIEAVEFPDNDRIPGLIELKAATDKRLREISDPTSDFRKEIQRILDLEMDSVRTSLNHSATYLQSEFLTKTVESPMAHNSDSGPIWVGRQLNVEINRISLELTEQIQNTFNRISMMPQFDGALNFDQFEALKNPITEQYVNISVPLHKRMMSVTSGLGVYALCSMAVGSFIPVVGNIAALGAAGYVAWKNQSETVNYMENSKLISAYQPQLSIAISDLRSYIDKCFRDFKGKWISTITEQTNSLRDSLQQTILEIQQLQKEIASAEVRKQKLLSRLKPFENAISLI